MLEILPIGTLDALCLKEPWLELVLLGIKTLETRTRCLRRRGGRVVLTSSRSIDFVAWGDPRVGGRLDTAARNRALGGLGKLAGIVRLGHCREGVPGQDDGRALIDIRLTSARNRFVWEVREPRRVERVPTWRIAADDDGSCTRRVRGAKQGFFKVAAADVVLLGGV